MMRCSIVPPYLLARLAQLDDPQFARTASAAQRSLQLDQPLRSVRIGETPPPTGYPRPGLREESRETVSIAAVQRTISTASNTEDLPGTVVRREGAAATGDIAVTEAYDGLGHTHDFFAQAYGRASIDDNNLPLNATVHYGDDYDNAFWNGERMVFGDGDEQVFTRMTASLTVIGHELTHGVTQYSAGLDYSGQSGALNESISDVFGALVEQFTRGQTAETATWLIGAGIFTAAVQGTALRSMKAPGTAYDDDVLGKDPQPDSMDGYVTTKSDSGGVHLNSGIPNRAFYLAAAALGGSAWERAGQIWYDTLLGGTLEPDADFAAFASATVAAAGARYGAKSAEVDAVTAGWTTVKVL